MLTYCGECTLSRCRSELPIFILGGLSGLIDLIGMRELFKLPLLSFTESSWHGVDLSGIRNLNPVNVTRKWTKLLSQHGSMS